MSRGEPIYSEVASDIYTRKYVIKPSFFEELYGGLFRHLFGDTFITVYTECMLTTGDIKKHGEYLLEIYFSVGTCVDREFLIGLPFGETQLEKNHLDSIIDGWVESTVSDPDFLDIIEHYLKAIELYEEWIETILPDSPSKKALINAFLDGSG